MVKTVQNKLPLLPERHPSKDFFIADIFDSISFKDDMASMEHPIFSLSKKKDLRDLEYKSGETTITIKATSDGLPNIFDKDILLYCGSLLMEEVNKGKVPPKTLRISSHDLLVATNRPTSGEGYSLLRKALVEYPLNIIIFRHDYIFHRSRGARQDTEFRANYPESSSAFERDP